MDGGRGGGAATAVADAPRLSTGRVYNQPLAVLDEESSRWPSPGTGAWPTPEQAEALATVLHERGLCLASIGCGEGALEAMLERRGVSVVAVDLDVISNPDSYNTIKRFTAEVRRVRPDELYDLGPDPNKTALGFFWGRATPWRRYLQHYQVPMCCIIGEQSDAADPGSLDAEQYCSTQPCGNALDGLVGWRRVLRMPVRAVHPRAILTVYERDGRRINQ